MTSQSAAVLMKALDGLSARAEAIAQNLANAQSPAYAPVRVKFEQALADAARRGGAAVRQVKPQFERASGLEAQAGVRIDLELANAATTAGRYAALVEVLNRQFQIRAAALQGDH